MRDTADINRSGDLTTGFVYMVFLVCFRGKDDFYSNLASMAENDVESDISDADVGKMAKSIAVSLI